MFYTIFPNFINISVIISDMMTYLAVKGLMGLNSNVLNALTLLLPNIPVWNW